MFPNQNKKHCPNLQPQQKFPLKGFECTTRHLLQQQLNIFANSQRFHLIRISFVLFFPVSVHFCLKHYQRNSLTFGIYELILRKICYVLIVINILR